ncbi:MAG TPA: hypothetical protein VIY29_22215 [Ktedonobacteraceae bacterium]
MGKLEESSPLQERKLPVERVQIGVRMEKRMVKVLKALAEYLDMSLGDLLEGMTLHVFENKLPFNKETLERIGQLKHVYDMDYGISASHHFTESTVTNNEHNEHISEGGDR